MAFWRKNSETSGQISTPTASSSSNGPRSDEGPPAAPTDDHEVRAKNPDHTDQLSAEQAQQRAAVSKQLLMSFGQIVSVMMRTPQFKQASLSDLDDMVVPALVTGQFVIAEAQSRQSGHLTPVGMALWASVSDELDQRFAANPDAPIRLARNEWKSGNNPWLIAVAGDRRLINPLLQRLHVTTFRDRSLKMRVRDEDGGYRITEFTPAPTPP